MAAHLSGQLEEGDLVSAQGLHHRWSSGKRLLVGAASLLAVAPCIGLMLRDGPRRIGFILLFGVAGAWVGGAVVRLWYIPYRSRKVFRQQRTLRRPFEMSWDSEAFTCRNATGESRTPWGDFVRWKEGEDLFLLYHSDVMFQMVPKRAFPDANAIIAFRRVLEERIVA